MGKRPLEDVRPLGPILQSSSYSKSDDSTSTRTLPPDVDKEELEGFREEVAEEIGVELTSKEAYALDSIDSPMLKSYLMNSMRDLLERGHERNFKQILNADPAEDYARKLGVPHQLQEAQEVLGD